MIERPAMADILPAALPERVARDRPVAGGFERMLGVAAEAAPATARDGNALEVSFTDADGAGQSIVLPWRLFANDALSQLLQTTQVGAVEPMTRSGTTSTQSRMVSANGMVHGMAPSTGASAANVGEASVTLLPLVTARDAAAGVVSRGAKTSPLPAHPGSAEPWQTRLLRWLENADGGVLARLRDYRLDPMAESRCVEQIVAFAREHGLQLQRVVVNAREAWRAPR